MNGTPFKISADPFQLLAFIEDIVNKDGLRWEKDRS